jgi:hypothetical protein
MDSQIWILISVLAVVIIGTVLFKRKGSRENSTNREVIANSPVTTPPTVNKPLESSSALPSTEEMKRKIRTTTRTSADGVDADYTDYHVFKLFGTNALLGWNEGEHWVTVWCLKGFSGGKPTTTVYGNFVYNTRGGNWSYETPRGAAKAVIEEIKQAVPSS